MKHLEAIEQRLFVKRWRLDPRTKDLPACSIPNGGKRGKLEAALMKAEGVSAGVPDWLLFEAGQDTSDFPHSLHVGLALEFKSPSGKGRVSPEQAAWIDKLRVNGWRVEVVTSAVDAWTVACDYLGLTE